MNLFAKGKVIKQEGAETTIELSQDELGKALLSFMINNADTGVGEKFIQSFLSGKPMSLSDLLVTNVIEAKKKSNAGLEANENKNSIEENNIFQTKNEITNEVAESISPSMVKEFKAPIGVVETENNAILVEDVKEDVIVKSEEIVEDAVNTNDIVEEQKINVIENKVKMEVPNEDSDIINILKNKSSLQVRVLDIKDKCEKVYERIIKTKNGINSQIIANCDIRFNFKQEDVTYSFITYKKGTPNIITPNKNVVFAWNESISDELREMFSLI